MANARNTLENLTLGDIFHASSPNGASLTCVVTDIRGDTIYARVIMSQICIIFDKQTGSARRGERQVICTIDSIAPLPTDIRNVMLGIDLKFRSNRDREHLQLTKSEAAAVLFLKSHYAASPL